MALQVLKLFQSASRLPLGRRLFTQVFQRAAPYFRTIPVLVESLEPGVCVVRMQDRRRIRNHIGTIHAIALCNLAELAMGAVAEATVPPTHRWLPKGMTVQYLAKAQGPVRATARLSWDGAWPDKQEMPVEIAVRDGAGQDVFQATIRIWVTQRPRTAGEARA